MAALRNVERRDDLVVRLYDLSDLFAVALPYNAEKLEGLNTSRTQLFPRPAVEDVRGGGGMGGGGMGGGGGFFNVPDQMPKRTDLQQQSLHQRAGNTTASVWASMDDLIQAITGTISPTSWDEVGGSGSIARLGNALLISSTRQNHEQIEALLQLFRQRWGTLRTISVRAWWLWLDETQLTGLLRGNPPRAKGEAPAAFGVVDGDSWQKLLATFVGPDRPEHTGYRASLTCYNGQTVSTQSARQSTLVTDIQPKILPKEKDSDRVAVIYQATTAVIQEGAAVQMTPISNTSGRYVVLDIHSQVSELVKQPAAARPAVENAEAGGLPGPAEIIAAIDRPKLSIQQLATTLRVPSDEVMLVGGMTSDTPPDAERPNLFLFVKVTVQELRDDRESREMQPRGEKAPADKPAANKPAEGKPAGDTPKSSQSGQLGDAKNRAVAAKSLVAPRPQRPASP